MIASQNSQIDAGFIGQVLSVSVGLSLRVRRIRWVRVDKGLRSAI